MTPTRILRLYRVFVRNTLVREMEFRGNFWAAMGTNAAWLLLSIVFLEIVFRNTAAIAGWTKGEMVLLLGTFMITRSLGDIFFTPNLSKIPEMVRMGTLDFVLTKPVPSQFFISTRFLQLDESSNLLGGIAVFLYGVRLTHLTPSITQVGAWALLMLCGCAVFYALQLVLMTLAFWLVRIDNLWALADTVINTARQPISIFGRRLGFLLTYILPLAFVAYVPVLAFKEGVHWEWLASGLGVTLIFLSLASWFWRYATRAYTSASS